MSISVSPLARATALALLWAAASSCSGKDISDYAGVSDAAVIRPDAAYPLKISCGDGLVRTGDVSLAKNIIFIMGDGMGPAQIEGGRILNGGPLRFESLGEPIYLNTDSLSTDQASDPDLTPTDSAAGATAFATGVRVVNETISVDEDGAPLETVLEMAQARGKAVGLITTSMVYDASPMAFAGHAPDRDSYSTLIEQLLSQARPDVIFGGGVPEFAANDGEYFDLAVEQGYQLVRDQDQLTAWDPTANPRVLGLFEASVVAKIPDLWEWFTTPVSMRDDSTDDPRLPDMVARALDRLEDSPDGFFLFVENEHPDTLGHIAFAERENAVNALPPEVREIDAAAAVVLDWVDANSSFEETLVIVTADHETGMYTLYGDDLSKAYFWGSPDHTRQPVALYAAGPGTDKLGDLCRISDVHLLMTGQLP